MESKAAIPFSGWFTLEHYRGGKLLNKQQFPNGATDVGKNHVLDVVAHNASQVHPWYLGLIDSSGYSALASADTMSSHVGWNEFTTYDETIRVEWDEAAASGQAITSSTVSQFNISGSGTIKGVFACSDSTKGGTSGTLLATALFETAVAVVNGDVLKVTYTLNMG